MTSLLSTLKSLLERLGKHPWVGLGVLLAVWLPLTAYRAHLETNFWIDETYSAMLATHPVSRLVELTSADAHPPGYYLALKVWIKVGRVLGLDPGILWARSLNVMFWVGLAVVAWFGARVVAGARDGPLVAWMVAGSAMPALVARDLRSYGIASVALFVSFLALVLLVRDDGRGPGRGQTIGLWALYAVASSLALWTHLLSTLALVLVVLLWAGLLVRRHHLTRSFVVGAVCANGLVALSFLPWLAVLGQQLGFLDRSRPEWMTPPTLANLFRVFTFWYPFGRLGDAASPENRWLVPLGVLAVALPLAAGLWALRRGAGQKSLSFSSRVAVSGIGSGLLLRDPHLAASSHGGDLHVPWTPVSDLDGQPLGRGTCRARGLGRVGSTSAETLGRLSYGSMAPLFGLGTGGPGLS